jgi:hypothetical protein
VTALRSNDIAAKDQAATTLAGVQASRRLTAAGSGVSALPGQLDLLAGGQQLALDPYMALSQILGSPTVLNEASSTSTGRAGSSSSSVQGSQEQYTNTSSSRQRQYNFGLTI